MKKYLCVASLSVVVAGLCITPLVARPGGDAIADSAVVERFLHSGEPRLESYRGVRHLEASTRGGTMRAELDAWTFLDPDGTFRFEVIRESGSSVIRSRVLAAALEAEARSHNQRETGTAALTPANYDFLVSPGPQDGQLVLALTPKRRSQMLIAGRAIVTATDADLLRVEGRLSKSPSFWTRHVDVVRRYARLGGVRVPVEMTSIADVRIVGDSTFSMTYYYERINGREVGD